MSLSQRTPRAVPVPPCAAERKRTVLTHLWYALRSLPDRPAVASLEEAYQPIKAVLGEELPMDEEVIHGYAAELRVSINTLTPLLRERHGVEAGCVLAAQRAERLRDADMPATERGAHAHVLEMAEAAQRVLYLLTEAVQVPLE